MYLVSCVTFKVQAADVSIIMRVGELLVTFSYDYLFFFFLGGGVVA